MGKLKWTQVTALTVPGRYADRDGLYLQVARGGSKTWIFRYQLHRHRREMGLGSISEISLAHARELTLQARKHVAAGRDPIQAREAARAAQRLADAQVVTFKQAAEQLIESQESGWRNDKHRQQWRNTLETYAYPVIGTLAVGAVETTHVLKILSPIWTKKTETASRVRGRIERVLSAAKAAGQRTGENPAQWRGHLNQLLPPRSKVRRVRHQPALPYQQMPPFMADLRALGSISARALEFTILTAVRTTETRKAVRTEINRKAKLWTIPPERMKAQREHRVPLSDAAITVVEQMWELRISSYLFPGARPKEPLSDMALLECLRGLRKGYTVHGFRSTFRDWAAETTPFPNEVVEMALAHAIQDKTEAAYRRGDLLEKRRELMQAWAEFCAGAPAPKTSTPEGS